MSVNVGQVQGRIVLFDDWTGVLIKAEKGLDRFAERTSRAAASLAPMSLAISGAIAGASALSNRFDETLRRMSALAGVASEDIGRVRDRIMELAPATAIGPNALADAMMVVASTVSDTTVGLQILESAAKSSSAGLGDAKDVARALTSVINSYGAANITAAQASDILVATVKEGGAEADEMAGVLGRVVPIAAQVGVKFDEVGAFMATFTKLGISASESVTALRGVLTTLLGPTKDAEDALGGIGLTIEELRDAVRERGLTESMIELMTAFDGNVSAIEAVFGNVRALAGVMGTAGQQADTYRAVLKSLQESMGLTDKAADEMAKSQGRAWKEFKVAVEDTAIAFGDALAPSLNKTLEATTPLLADVGELAKSFSELPDSIQKTTFAVLAFGAAISPVLFALSGISKAAGLVVTAFAKFAALGAVVGGVATAVVGLAVAWAKYKEDWTRSFDVLFPPVGMLRLAVEAVRKELEAVGSRIDRLRGKMNLSPIYSQPPSNVLPHTNLNITGLATAPPMVGPTTGAAFEHGPPPGFAAQMRDVEKAVAGLTASRIADIVAGDKMGKSAEEIAERMKIPVEVIEVFLDRSDAARKKLEEFREETERFGQAAEASQDVSIISDRWVQLAGTYEQELAAVILLTDRLDGEQRRAIDSGMRLGHSVEQIADNLKISKDVVGLYVEQMTEMWKENDKLVASNVDLTATFSKLETQAGTYEQLLQATRHEVAGLTKDQRQNITAGLAMGRSFEEVAKQLGISVDAVRMFVEQSKGLNRIANEFARIGQIVGGLGGTVLGSIGTIVSGLARAQEIAASSGGRFGVLSEAFRKGATSSEQFGAALAAAGSVAQGVQDILAATATTTSKLSGAMQGMLSGAAAGSVFGPIGTAIGAIGGALFGAFRAASNARKAFEELRRATSDLQQEFRETYPEIQNLDRVAGMLGITFIRVTEQWHLEALSEQIEFFADQLSAVRDEFSDLLGEADAIGIGLPAALRDSIQQMIDLGIVTGGTADLFHSLLSSGASDWEKMAAAAEKYGIEQELLGQQFQQSRLTSGFTEILSAIQLLREGGTDIGVIIGGMSDEISTMVQESLKFGTQIPENMRDIIQAMMDGGSLTDEFGQQMTDLARINWGPAVETQFDRLIRKIEELIDRLAQAPGLMDDISRSGSGVRPPDGFEPTPNHTYSPSSSFAMANGPAFEPELSAKLYIDGKQVTDVVINRMGSRLALQGGRA